VSGHLSRYNHPRPPMLADVHLGQQPGSDGSEPLIRADQTCGVRKSWNVVRSVAGMNILVVHLGVVE
jgi:hypothetical protein